MFTKPFKGHSDKENHVHTRVLYKHARLLNPATELEIPDAFLITACDKIADFGDMKALSVKEGEFDEVVDCKGLVLAPGLIDIQVHFRDPGQTHKEDVTSGSKAAVAGGVTTVVCQPNTAPTLDCKEALDYLYNKARDEAYCNVFAYASVTKALKGEEVNEIAGLAAHPLVVGFTDDGLPVANSHFMRLALEASAKTGKVIAQHAEDLPLSNKGCINEGAVSAKLGVRGIHNLSESLIVERDVMMAKHFGGRYHVLHLSTKEALEAVRLAKLQGLPVTCEASPHHLLLTDEAVLQHGTNAKMNPPLRSREDMEALQEALFEGVIDAIATDHAPHDPSVKEKPLGEAAFGIIGVQQMLPLVLKFYHEGKISLMKLLGLMTHRPAKIIGFDGGVIERGARADLVLLDLNHEWVITKETSYSKCYNTPFDGVKVKGIAQMTVVSGTICYKR